MERSPLMRQQSLDFSQSKSAMKVLEKYCRKKYRYSSAILGGSPSFNHESDLGLTPELLSPSHFQTTTPQLSTFSSIVQPSTFYPDRPQTLFFKSQDASETVLTPRAVSEFLEPPIKEEIK